MKYYFSGIGGIGMSSIALHTFYNNEKVYGSNNIKNERIEYLKTKGIEIKTKQDKTLPDDLDYFIKSTAIKDDNPEVIAAKKMNIPIISRMEFLNSILKENKSLGITGTDGKTSTTAMISQIFKVAGKCPTVFLGGIHDSLKDGNYSFGEDLIIAEADESDGYIKKTIVDFLIVTNLRPDHLEHYDNDFENLKNSIENAINNTKQKVFINNDDKNLEKMNIKSKNVITFGLSEESNYYFKNRNQVGKYQEFEVYYNKVFLGKITMSTPGLHYALDALAAIAFCHDYGIGFKYISEGLFSYKNVDRRFNILYSNTSRYIIDDYAHTPEEIRHTIQATREFFPDKKIVSVFQPHRYTRLHREKDQFVDSLLKSDEIVVYKIYSAFEKPIEGIKENYVVDKLIESKKNAIFINNTKILFKYLSEYSDTVFLFLGAGDISKVAYEFKEHLDKMHVRT
ncbi:UDP-N-acetylmuramate--L-alanine ligase [Geotoga petraea]|uniref:UDP-N-acetylmuramate--L-alanine ligase n=1 Tax=Geotoga petraea TaxID=28234 RepID=A0A1G6NM24_9BACT|nr:UDP-N-acetylmuramate--L-alanine ligase [Geotoga petraea]TGG87832.1 UDP-N-acetylmuramate--L-alanine ligase [Geotoga petraea]SDC68444.1 UDP-N-acetylmuramate--L-alanine ligase [Geotoga petraea]